LTRKKLVVTLVLLGLVVLAEFAATYKERCRLSWAIADRIEHLAAPVDNPPPRIRAFLTQAKAADAIADPLARCLAFPDLPVNKWPAGLARAHCNYAFGPRIVRKQIGQLLDRGATVELDALFRKDLDRHFSQTDFSEVIHADFRDIDASQEWNLLTARWLTNAPNSPFALTARARYFQNVAVAARGKKTIQEMSTENLRVMSENAAQSIALYRQALTLEPRLMPAYAGLIAVGTLDSKPDVARLAFEQATKVDSGCMAVADSEMAALRPEPGGDYGPMYAYFKKLKTDATRRPLLLLSMARPYIAEGRALRYGKKYEESRRLLLGASERSTAPETFEGLANTLDYFQEVPERWNILVYLLEDSRFQVPASWPGQKLGMDLRMLAADPGWSATVLERYVALWPDDGFGHSILGRSYEKDQKASEAEQQYLLAAKDPEQRSAALGRLYWLATRQCEHEKARRYAAIVKKEFPDDMAKYHMEEP
jgi:tetratricopeptide (TPR) repeat protein